MKKAMSSVLNVPPFNIFFFSDCFYNILFAMLRYKEVSITPILLNTSLRMEYDEYSGLPEIYYLPYLSLEVLLNRMGMPVCYSDKINGMIEDIISGISNDITTGVYVDCINLPVRKDTFCKLHNDHCILVCGIDECALTILEQSSMNVLNYRAVPLDMADLITASEGYKNYYIDAGRSEKHRYFQLKKGQSDHALYKELIDYYCSALINILEEDKIATARFAQRLIAFLVGGEKMNFDQTIRAINEIINFYKISKFLHQELWPEVTVTINELLVGWSYLRMTLFRHVEGVQTDPDSLKKVYQKIMYSETILQDQFFLRARNEIERGKCI